MSSSRLGGGVTARATLASSDLLASRQRQLALARDHLLLLAERASASAGLLALDLDRPAAAQPQREPRGERHPQRGRVERGGPDTAPAGGGAADPAQQLRVARQRPQVGRPERE